MTASASVLVPIAGLTGAVLVAVANYAVQRWRYRLDRTSLAVDHLCIEINEAADEATAYWLLDPTQNADLKQVMALEPRLIGRQTRLSELLSALRALDRRLPLGRVDELVPDLFEGLTGGNFRVASRHAEPAQAQDVQHSAARLNGALRSSIADRARLWT